MTTVGMPTALYPTFCASLINFCIFSFLSSLSRPSVRLFLGNLKLEILDPTLEILVLTPENLELTLESLELTLGILKLIEGPSASGSGSTVFEVEVMIDSASCRLALN